MTWTAPLLGPPVNPAGGSFPKWVVLSFYQEAFPSGRSSLQHGLTLSLEGWTLLCVLSHCQIPGEALAAPGVQSDAVFLSSFPYWHAFSYRIRKLGKTSWQTGQIDAANKPCKQQSLFFFFFNCIEATLYRWINRNNWTILVANWEQYINSSINKCGVTGDL